MQGLLRAYDQANDELGVVQGFLCHAAGVPNDTNGGIFIGFSHPDAAGLFDAVLSFPL
jgi:hypothetical protein